MLRTSTYTIYAVRSRSAPDAVKQCRVEYCITVIEFGRVQTPVNFLNKNLLMALRNEK